MKENMRFEQIQNPRWRIIRGPLLPRFGGFRAALTAK